MADATRPPLISPPIALVGPDATRAAPVVDAFCRKASPFAGLVGATLLGATAAYFVPKAFDWALGRYVTPPEGYRDEVELEVDDDPR